MNFFRDSKIVAMLRIINVAFVVLFVAYTGAHISDPEDPLFFYAVGSKISRSWVVLIVCTLGEVLCLSSATATCMFATYNGLSYVYAMRSLSK